MKWTPLPDCRPMLLRFCDCLAIWDGICPFSQDPERGEKEAEWEKYLENFCNDLNLSQA